MKTNDTIPALWFTRDGMGPSELALQLHPFAAEREGRIPASLGIRVSAISGPGVSAMIFGPAVEMVGGGFNMGRHQVEELHRQLGAWLAETAPAAPAPADAAPGPESA